VNGQSEGACAKWPPWLWPPTTRGAGRLCGTARLWPRGAILTSRIGLAQANHLLGKVPGPFEMPDRVWSWSEESVAGSGEFVTEDVQVVNWWGGARWSAWECSWTWFGNVA